MAKLFTKNAQFPPQTDIERIAKYLRGKAIFDGKQAEIYERATEILKDTPHAEQLRKLYIACNVIDILVTKPADMLVGEPPTYESGNPADSTEQKRLNSIVEENDLNTLLHEMTVGNGYRGDAWLKTYYDVRQDMSEVPEGFEVPDVSMEPIIETVDALHVFPEFAKGSRKQLKAVNIAFVEYVENRDGEEIPFLNVERHVPGYILYERYRLHEKSVDTSYFAPIQIFSIGEQFATGREDDVIETGVPRLLTHHVPYKAVDDRFFGISGVEKLESVLAAINDRLVQIDYILWKHADPTAYGPDLDGDIVQFGGKYIPVRKEEQTPGYMVWNAQLDSAFKELDILLGIVFMMSETPQWLFGTTLTEDRGGTGTSHTDGAAIKSRFMPIISKVNRIRAYVDKAVRDALWTAMELENYANEGVDGFTSYEAPYPKIIWSDSLPKNMKEEAEAANIRTGGKSTLDVQTAIKRMDNLDDTQALEIISRIEDDGKREGFVDGSIFNEGDE